ncbi:E3 ubiquitin-protein ligase [Platanthera guangdongensis]|uniref:E3 ubiquitin-protein ligase n=1 Tax=Platanthera guangdongensis TaxID=2320717 RepID=A0ABR2ME07_9ASPA
MERPVSTNADEHAIDIVRNVSTSATTSIWDIHNNPNLHSEGRSSTTRHVPDSQLPSRLPAASNSRSASFPRNRDTFGRRQRSPLNSGFWISIELLVNLSQIAAALIVLSFSRKEHPHAPLFTWVIGYTAGCIATLPHLFWRYINRNSQTTAQSSANSVQSLPQNSAISVARSLQIDNSAGTGGASQLGQNPLNNARRLNLNALVDHFKMALDFLFAVWFVVGNVWIFGGHSSASDAPNLYRLCLAFLTFSCIGYAMPFVLCVIICCCLPCIISVMGLREDMVQTRGATTESINSLPVYKFKAKRRRSAAEREMNLEGEGGILVAGTDKEQTISAEDAECCICLAKYEDNDDIRELPCHHFFHLECINKWLKINTLCPLCKAEVTPTVSS